VQQQQGSEHPWVANSPQHGSAASLLAAARGGAVCLLLPAAALGLFLGCSVLVLGKKTSR